MSGSRLTMVLDNIRRVVTAMPGPLSDVGLPDQGLLPLFRPRS
jgi:hypothetical protein